MVKKGMISLLRTSTARPQQPLLTAARQSTQRPRALHSSTLKAAVAHPITAHGPPPKAPSPSPGSGERATQKTEDQGKISEAEPEPRPIRKPATLKKRFWKDVDFQRKQGIFATIYPFPYFFPFSPSFFFTVANILLLRLQGASIRFY